MYSCSPLVSFCEEVDGVKQWSSCFVEGGGVQGDLMKPAVFPLLQAEVRAANNAAPDKHHSDFMDDAVFGAQAIKDGEPCFDIVDMFVAANTAAKKWGGRNSPTKAEIFIPAGLTSEERGMYDLVIAKFEEANGGPVQVLGGDASEVARQGMVVLGSAQGTPSFAAEEYSNTFESKRMIPEVFQLLTRQQQMLMISYCEQRFNYRTRTDLDVAATRRVRDEVDTYLFGATDDNPGIIFTGPLAMMPSELSAEQHHQLRARLAMTSVHGGLSLRPLTVDGEFGQLATLSFLFRDSGTNLEGIVPHRQWLADQVRAGTAATSATAAFIHDQVERFEELHRDVLEDKKFDPTGVFRKHLPLSALALADGQVVTQQAMRAVQSHQLRRVWESGASTGDIVFVNAMSGREWLNLTRTLPTAELLRAPDAEYAAALRAQLGVVPRGHARVKAKTTSTAITSPPASSPASALRCTPPSKVSCTTAPNLVVPIQNPANPATNPIQTTMRGALTS
jgi:hypothetical protein